MNRFQRFLSELGGLATMIIIATIIIFVLSAIFRAMDGVEVDGAYDAQVMAREPDEILYE